MVISMGPVVSAKVIPGIDGLRITATRGPLIPGWSGWVASTPSSRIQSLTQQAVTIMLNMNTGEGGRNWVASPLEFTISPIGKHGP